MRIQFCGADRTVTGSCHFLSINGLNILLDMGLYQGARDEADRLNHYLPPGAAQADAIILSHGHLDHCGKLPVVVRNGYKNPIYCTPPTAEVARIVMEDAGQIQEEDAQFLNRRSRTNDAPPLRPLFTRADVAPVLKLFRHVDYAQKTDLGRGVSFTFYDAGHILGSAYVILQWTELSQPKSLLFTADVGRYDPPILRSPTTLPGPVDHLITESTYGNRSHGPIADVEPQFLDAVKTCIAKRGRLLAPSFAVGRTQAALWYIEKFVFEGKIAPIPIYVDSPMGSEISKITSSFRTYYNAATTALIGQRDLFGLSRVTFASSVEESKQINRQQGPCVIIASSPTCEFGRILHHLTQSVECENDMVIFTGWIPYNTLGRRLQDGQKRVRILDRWYDLRCQVRTIHGLSAHADGDELLRFLTPTLKPQTQAYVVHGEVDQAEAFAQRLLKAGIGQATVPAMESSAYQGDGAPVVTPATTKGEED